MRDVGSFGTCSESTVVGVQWTTIRSAALVAGAVIAVAVDVAGGVDGPLARILEGVVLSVAFFTLVRLLDRDMHIALTDPESRGARQEAAFVLTVLVIAVVPALWRDGFGLMIAVYMVALAVALQLMARAHRPAHV